MTRRWKRNLTIALLLLFLFLFSGCGSTGKETGPDISVLPESLQELSFEKHLDISIGYWNIDAMEKTSQPDGMTEYIEELFNITLQPVSVTWANYKERYQILSATDSLPDVFATLTLSSNDSNDSAFFENMIQAGSIRALPDDMSAYPHLQEVLEAVSYTKYRDGKYYAIPRISFTDPILGATDAAILVRRDWMNKLGLDDPQTFEEFVDMTVAFAHEDPDGNGIDDTAGYNVTPLAALGKWVMLGIAPECNVYSWVEENGRYVPSWTTENFKKVVSAYRILYESGGLDPVFYSKAENTVLEDFAAGRLGAIEYKSSPAAIEELKEKWLLLNDQPFAECVDVLPVFPAPDGVCYSNSSSIFWSESFISSTADDDKVERILALYEILLTEKGRDFCRYGIEGIDYLRTEDGDYVCLLELDEQNLATVLDQKYPSRELFCGIATWAGGSWLDFEINEMNILQYGVENITLANRSALWNRDNTTQLERPYAFLNFPKESTDLFSTAQALQAFIKCIISDGDPIELWEKSLQTMREQGLEEYIDRQNANYRDYR